MSTSTPARGGRHAAGGRAFTRRVFTHRAFTLVELLVVIGIIAVLIAILMPALSMARESAKTAKCLSNLRQIHFAIEMYANDHDGCLVPGDHWSAVDGFPLYPGPGGGSWAVILSLGNYLPIPEGSSSTITQKTIGADANFFRETVLTCPNGQEMNMADYGFPATQEDARGAMFTVRREDFSLFGVATWYAVNGSPVQDLLGLPKLPFQCLPDVYPDGSLDWRINRLSQFKQSSSLPMVFDGVWMFYYGSANINARHNNMRSTNILFADGHAETEPTDQLPNVNWFVQ